MLKIINTCFRVDSFPSSSQHISVIYGRKRNKQTKPNIFWVSPSFFLRGLVLVFFLASPEKPDTGEAHVSLTKQPQPCASLSLLWGSSPKLHFPTPLAQLASSFFSRLWGEHVVAQLSQSFMLFLTRRKSKRKQSPAEQYSLGAAKQPSLPFPALPGGPRTAGTHTHTHTPAPAFGGCSSERSSGAVSVLSSSSPSSFGVFLWFCGLFLWGTWRHILFSLLRNASPKWWFCKERKSFWEGLALILPEREISFAATSYSSVRAPSWHWCTGGDAGHLPVLLHSGSPRATAPQRLASEKDRTLFFPSQGGKPEALVSQNRAGSLLFIDGLAASDNTGRTLRR